MGDEDLSFLGIENTTRTLKTFGDTKKVGIQKSILWDRLSFVLCLEGYAPLAALCHSIRYDGNTLVFSDEYSKILEITFNKCFYFGDDNCNGIVDIVKQADNYLCYDWVAFNIGGKHDYDYIETDDDFVNKILFHISRRNGASNSNIKDACVISTLKREQIDSFDYSQTMARFKVIHEMRSRGMRARISEYHPDGRPKNISHIKLLISRGK